MVTVQGQNMGREKNILKVIMYKKIYIYNFDVETSDLKIDKCLNAMLLKFNMLLHYM